MESKKAIDHLNKVLGKKNKFAFIKYFKEGIDIWKQNWTQFVGFVVLVMIINLILVRIPYLGKILNALLFIPALTLGGILASFRIDFFQEIKFKNFFSGFKFSWDLFLFVFIKYAILLICLVPFIISVGMANVYVVEGGGLQDITGLDWGSINFFVYLFFIPLVYFYIAFFYGICFIGIYRLDPWQALKYSVKIIGKYWFRFFFFILSLGIFSLLGFVGFFVGILVTISIYYPVFYSSFKDMTALTDFKDGIK